MADIPANNTQKDYISSVTLLITGEKLDPNVVTEKLSLVASQSWKKGEKRTFPNGREHVYAWGGWKRFAKEQESALLLEAQLEAWFCVLSPKATVIKSLKSLGLSVTLDCYISVSNAVTAQIESELLSKLGNLGTTVALNIFNNAKA
jgi:hypothetical protein